MTVSVYVNKENKCREGLKPSKGWRPREGKEKEREKKRKESKSRSSRRMKRHRKKLLSRMRGSKGLLIGKTPKPQNPKTPNL